MTNAYGRWLLCFCAGALLTGIFMDSYYHKEVLDAIEENCSCECEE